MPPKKISKRHRHSEAQLDALNRLFDETEHPTLAQRTALGQSIGLETKSVSSFFQNKRAKKQHSRGVGYIAGATLSDLDPDFRPDDSYPENPPISSFSSDNLNLPDSFSNSQPMSVRTSALDLKEPPKVYDAQKHGTADINALRYQSEVNWLDPQLDPQLPRLDEPKAFDGVAPEDGDLSRPFPPVLDQPSLTERGRRSNISTVLDDGLVSRSRRASSRRSTTPYSPASAIVSFSSRQRRARPEPSQLDGLKRLYNKTATPSIEERSALALEIGMEVVKVTNWFRNLRQSARKRAKKAGRQQDSEDDLDYTDGGASPSVSTPVSRAGSPSSSSLEQEDGISRHLRLPEHVHSSDDEEEDEEPPEEAVTPSQSPSPTSSPARVRKVDSNLPAALQEAVRQMAKEEKYRDLVADVLLLLEFQATSA
ncbi:distal-less homeobox 3 [Favolaschia claudopus]|uniref:Distal-less homeobox 3 n=1 Tax=Favolaschia claudopus TaxID=2862362 RepID=A0AAW0EHR5_9AGAR